MANPRCEICGKDATVIVFLSEQHYRSPIVDDDLPDLDNCVPIGLPERVGDDCYYCTEHALEDC